MIRLGSSSIGSYRCLCVLLAQGTQGQAAPVFVLVPVPTLGRDVQRSLTWWLPVRRTRLLLLLLIPSMAAHDYATAAAVAPSVGPRGDSQMVAQREFDRGTTAVDSYYGAAAFGRDAAPCRSEWSSSPWRQGRVDAG